MDDELKAQVADFYRRALAEGASEEQALRLSRRFMAEQKAAGGPTIGPSGPTAMPAFPNLSPRAGSALDFLITLGNGLAWGAPSALSDRVAGVQQEIDSRNPRTATGVKMAGAALSVPVGGMMVGGAARVPSIAAAMLRTSAAKGLGAGLGLGGGVAGGYAAIRKLLGR